MVQVSTSITLHFDIKYSQIDFTIHRVLRSDFPDAERERLCNQVLHARDCDLGCFLRAYRKLFGDLASMLGPLGMEVLRLREALKGFSTMRSERGHASERRDLQSAQGSGKTFCHHARRDILRQVHGQHMRNNGADPLKKERRPTQEDAPRPLAADPFEAYLPSDMLRTLNDARSAVIQLEDLGRQAIAGAAPAQLVHGHPDAQQLQEPPPVASEATPEHHSGKGGSVYMLIKRWKQHAYKNSVGGRALTRDELGNITADAKREHAEAKLEGGQRWARWARMYQDEVAERQNLGPQAKRARGSVATSRADGPAASAQESAALKPYQPHLQLRGNARMPIQPAALLDFYRSCGLPKDERVYHSTEFIVGTGDVVHPLRGH